MDHSRKEKIENGVRDSVVKLQSAGIVDDWEVIYDDRNANYVCYVCRLGSSLGGYAMTTTFSVGEAEFEEVSSSDYVLRLHDAIESLIDLYQENEMRASGLDPEIAVDARIWPWLEEHGDRFETLRKQSQEICRAGLSEVIYDSKLVDEPGKS